MWIAGKNERQTFNAQHRMLNVKTKKVFIGSSTLDVRCSMLNVQNSDSCLLPNYFFGELFSGVP